MFLKYLPLAACSLIDSSYGNAFEISDFLDKIENNQSPSIVDKY